MRASRTTRRRSRPITIPYKRHAEERDENHGHEHRGGIERDLHLEHQVAETAIGAEEFADDGARDRKDRRHLHAGKDIGQCVGELDLGENLPARALHRAHQVDQVGLDLAQPPGRGEHDREEADGECHHHVRADAVAKPDNDERSERHLGDHVEADQERHHEHFERPRPREQQRGTDADDDGKRIAAEDFGAGDQGIFDPAVIRNEQRLHGGGGRRQDELRHVSKLDEEIPRQHQQQMADHRQGVALQHLAIFAHGSPQLATCRNCTTAAPERPVNGATYASQRARFWRTKASSLRCG